MSFMFHISLFIKDFLSADKNHNGRVSAAEWEMYVDRIQVSWTNEWKYLDIYIM